MLLMVVGWPQDAFLIWSWPSLGHLNPASPACVHSPSRTKHHPRNLAHVLSLRHETAIVRLLIGLLQGGEERLGLTAYS